MGFLKKMPTTFRLTSYGDDKTVINIGLCQSHCEQCPLRMLLTYIYAITLWPPVLEDFKRFDLNNLESSESISERFVFTLPGRVAWCPVTKWGER